MINKLRVALLEGIQRSKKQAGEFSGKAQGFEETLNLIDRLLEQEEESGQEQSAPVEEDTKA